MTTTTMSRGKTYDMVYIAVFAVLIAICSWISIPMSYGKPYGLFLFIDAGETNSFYSLRFPLFAAC